MKNNQNKRGNTLKSIWYEIQLQRQLNHPNLLKLKDIYNEFDYIFLVMDFYQGDSLAKQFNTQLEYNLQDIQEIMFQILEGIKYMHTNKRIMHRDLKPANIIFKNQYTNELVIADFGLSTEIDIQNYLFLKVGTPGNCAPEILDVQNDKSYTELCDIYSAGIIFHHLLMGYNPFDKKEDQLTPKQVIENNLKSKIQFDNTEYKLIPTASLRLLKKMLKKYPDSRISVQDALNHEFFQLKEIEMQKIINIDREFQQLSNYDVVFVPHNKRDQLSQEQLQIVNSYSGKTELTNKNQRRQYFQKFNKDNDKQKCLYKKENT
ncbi:Protein kinase-like domain [Pseudocohnilembus persalinus]|uniref:Protein kinase-like domain n=1 Tax=Pseudocohnilembus persalinus TaxID=266149 RepID=A0A0V0QTH3_PSEPJ|nr:Protein kinase-like domain [Pseudocohnilembus persalinus]|eukprot:KRX05479.1 Protein kinase-like domain [Pseudocohnilembus persalinus]